MREGGASEQKVRKGDVESQKLGMRSKEGFFGHLKGIKVKGGVEEKRVMNCVDVDGG